MHPFSMKRKIILAVAIVAWALQIGFILYLGSLKSYIKLLLSLTPMVFGVIQFMAAAASAVILMELLRVSLLSAKSLPEKKHFIFVILLGCHYFLFLSF